MVSLGNNIKSLRIAYGETQEDLGFAIGVEKNTISCYEKELRTPNKDKLAAIASHYMITVEELLSYDYSDMQKVNVNSDFFSENIEILLPIISINNDKKNIHFERAEKMHHSIYSLIKENDRDFFDKFDSCITEYIEAYYDENIKEEAAANIIALTYLLMMTFKNASKVINGGSAMITKFVLNDSTLRKKIEELDSDFINDAEEIVKELKVFEEDRLPEMKIAVKKSSKWSELADYYLALQYLWNIVDNGLEWEFNHRIGIEMLVAFSSVGNEYAIEFFRIQKYKFSIE